MVTSTSVAADMPFGQRWVVYPDLGMVMVAADLDEEGRRQALEELHAAVAAG